MRYPLAVLAVVAVLIPSPLYGQDESKQEDGRIAEMENEQQDAEDQKGAEADEKIQALFEEMNDVMEGPAEFARIVTDLKSELKSEYQQNEQQLQYAQTAGELSDTLEPKQIDQLKDRQKVIAQCYMELTERTSSDDPRRQIDLHREIRERFRKFRQENPTLAGDARIQAKEQELMQQAMQGRMRLGRTDQQTMAETMRDLSAYNDAAAATNAWDPIEPMSTLAHPGEQQGPIQNERHGLRAMLKLKWTGKNLSLDPEHWDVMFAGMTVAKVQSEVDRMLLQKGAKLDENRGGRRGKANATNVQRLFQELRGTGSNSHSRSGGGQNVQISFRKQSMEARMKLSAERFELTIEELHSPARLMRVVESEEGLEILLVGDVVLRFSAGKDGLKVVELSQDEVLKFEAESFADLYIEEPRFVEMRFFALLDHLGIIPPASRFHPQIVSRLLEIISMDEARLQAEVDRLLKDLDADRYTTREAAYAELLANIGDYYDLLYAKQEYESLSIEVLARIRRLLGASTVKEASQLDSVVSVLRLADDVEYLDELREIVDAEQRESIERWIESLRP